METFSHQLAKESRASKVSRHIRPSSYDRPSILQRRRMSNLKNPTIDCDLIVAEAINSSPFLMCAGALEKYELIRSLGQGSCGVVHLAKRKQDGEEVALKVMRLYDEEMLNIARHEYEILKELRHPCIIQAMDFFAFPRGAVLVLEHFPGVTLEAAVRARPQQHFTEELAHSFFQPLMGAVHYLHSNNIIHRDIKAENVLVVLELRELRLVDFNTARLTLDGALTMTGTADYLPPEVLLGDAHSQASDVWAAGLCLFFMLTGALPALRVSFPSHAEFGRAWLDRGCDLEEIKPLDLTAECEEVVRQCLEADVHERPNARAILEFPWLA